MNFDFLNDIKLEEAPVARTRSHVDTTPVEGAHLRLFKDGRVFPSTQLVEDYDLEYVNKDEMKGNGFDIIDTQNFVSYPATQPRIVMVALTSKDSPKVDLFGSVGYNEDGTPKTSVLTQGSSTTGKWLIELLTEVYGEELFPEGVRFVDLVIMTEYGLTTPNNIYHLPKTVNRGERKGEISYQRRTDTILWPLTVFSTTETEETNEESLEDTVDAVEETVEKVL